MRRTQRAERPNGRRTLAVDLLEERLMLDAVLAAGDGGDQAAQRALELFSISPALFVENQGQWADESVRFVHSGSGVNVAMTDAGPVFQLFRCAPSGSEDASCAAADLSDASDAAGLTPPGDRAPVPMEMMQFSAAFVGANTVAPVGADPSETLFNYVVGDLALHREGVASYEKVVYEGLYEGIDLHTWGLRSHLKYEFHVAPGADWSAIQVRYEGIAGLSLSDDGSLLIDLGGDWGVVTDEAPYIYQVVDGEVVEVSGRFVLAGDTAYAFEITGPYDAALPLILDPDLAWSTYLGGSDLDYARGIAVDGSGGVYVTGSTSSPDWVSGGYDTSYDRSYNAFVVKLSGAGAHLWSTYLGGGPWTAGYGIAVDGSGGVYVTGMTDSSGWVSGGYDTSYDGGYDAFVAKLSGAGGHLWSTYLGGDSDEWGNGIAVDGSGAVYVTGETSSSGWVSGGFDTSHNGGDDAFVARLSDTGAHLWSTYLGGIDRDVGADIAVDGSGAVYVTGATYSSGWVSGGYDTSYNGDTDAFVVKLSGTGAHLWSTYLGGDSYEWGNGIAVDGSGGVYVTGMTDSSGWVSGGFDTSHNGADDAFVARLSDTGAHLWSTYLGGSSSDRGNGIVVDGSGAVYVTGETFSSGWVSGGYDTSYNGDEDAFVVKLSGTGVHLWSTYLGGSSSDRGNGIVVDGSGAVYVTGETFSSGWVSGGYDTSYNGQIDGFVARTMALPDLQVIQLKAPSAPAGSTILLPTSVYNAGTVSTGSGFTVSYYLNGGTLLTATDNVRPALPSGAVDSFSASVTLPAGVVMDTAYIRAYADWDGTGGSIDEIDELNNTLDDYLTISAPVLPDLEVTSLTAPDASAGSTIHVPTTVRNTGAATTGSGFTVSYYLSDDATWSAADTLLAASVNTRLALSAGGSDTFTANVTLPSGVTGSKYIIAYADWNGTSGTITEGNESNNTRAAPVTISSLPTLSINDVQVTEGNSGTTNAVFTVTLSQASSQAVTVQYATANGTASAGTDYTSKSGTLTFAAGQTSQTASVTVLGDTTAEGNETFYLNLTSPTNATIADGQGLATILDDDVPQPDLTIPSLSAPDGVGGAAVAVQTTVENIGGATSGSAFLVSYYLSDDNIWDAGDTFLMAAGDVGPVGVSGSSTFSRSVTLPAGVSGSKYIIAYADWDGTGGLVSESNEANNTRAAAIYIGVPPTVEITAPSLAGQTATAGDIYRIRWTDHDPDSSATLTLYYDTDTNHANGRTQIVGGLSEDDEGDFYDWVVPGSLVGSTVYICADISDSLSTARDYSEGSVRVVGPNVAPSITVLSPSEAQDVSIGSTLRIEWTDSDPDSSATITLYWDEDTNPAAGLGPIAGGISEDAAQNYLDWAVPESLENRTIYIAAKIDDAVAAPVWSYSRVAVTVRGDNIPPTIHVLQPLFPESVRAGSLYRIQWTDRDPDSSASIRLFWDVDDDPANGLGETIVQGIPEDSETNWHDWLIPSSLLGQTVYIGAFIGDGKAQSYDYSNAPLTIGGTNVAPTIALTAPAAPTVGRFGERISVQWEDSDPDDAAVVNLYYDTDQDPANGKTLIANGIPEDSLLNSYSWLLQEAELSALSGSMVYIYGEITDGAQTVGSYAPGAVTVSGNVPPSIALSTPAAAAQIVPGATFRIEWVDADPDNNATITLYYDTNRNWDDGGRIAIANGLSEDLPTNSFDWTVPAALMGRSVYLCAEIADGHETRHAFATGSLEVASLVPSVTLAAPAHDVFLPVGDGYTIAWSATGVTPDAKVSLYLDTDDNLANGYGSRIGTDLPASSEMVYAFQSEQTGRDYYVHAVLTDGPNTDTATGAGRLRPRQMVQIEEVVRGVDVIAVLLGNDDPTAIAGKIVVKAGRNQMEISSITMKGGFGPIGLIVRGDEGVPKIGKVSNGKELYDNVAFLWLDAASVGTVAIKGGLSGVSDIEGAEIRYRVKVENIENPWQTKVFCFPDDADRDGQTGDDFAFYATHDVTAISMKGPVGGDLFVGGNLGTLALSDCPQGFSRDVWVGGKLTSFSLSHGDFGAEARLGVGGDLGSLSLSRNNLRGLVHVGGILTTGTVYGIQGGTVQAGSQISVLTVKTGLVGAKVLAGYDSLKGSDAQSWTGGIIRKLTVNGDVVNSVISAGASCGEDGLWGTSDDTGLGRHGSLDRITLKTEPAGSVIESVNGPIVGKIGKVKVSMATQDVSMRLIRVRP